MSSGLPDLQNQIHASPREGVEEWGDKVLPDGMRDFDPIWTLFEVQNSQDAYEVTSRFQSAFCHTHPTSFGVGVILSMFVASSRPKPPIFRA